MHYAVYEVLRPIEWLGARPGDLLYLRPSHPTHPLQLVRKCDRAAMVAILSGDDVLRVVEHSLDSPPPQVLPLGRSLEPPPQLVQHLRKLQQAG